MLTVLYIRITLSVAVCTLWTQLRQKELSAVPHDVLIAEGWFGSQRAQGRHFVIQLQD